MFIYRTVARKKCSIVEQITKPGGKFEGSSIISLLVFRKLMCVHVCVYVTGGSGQIEVGWEKPYLVQEAVPHPREGRGWRKPQAAAKKEPAPPQRRKGP